TASPPPLPASTAPRAQPSLPANPSLVSSRCILVRPCTSTALPLAISPQLSLDPRARLWRGPGARARRGGAGLEDDGAAVVEGEVLLRGGDYLVAGALLDILQVGGGELPAVDAVVEAEAVGLAGKGFVLQGKVAG